MQILSTGGTMSAIEEQPEATSTLERYSPKELAGFLNAFWDDQAHRPIPTDIRWEDYAPEKVMLRFKDELKRLQPYVEGWFSERGKSLPEEALQNPLLPSRMKQKCSVRFSRTASKNAVFLP